MNQGGINNPALIGASQREARNKLDVMAGIKRPQGIMASSPELIQAAMPAVPTPIPPPVMPMPMPPVQPTLPQMPINTAVAPMVPAPRSLNPMAPAVPTVPQPDSPTTPMNFQEAGPVAVNPGAILRGANPVVDISMDAVSFMKGLLEELPGDIQQNLLDQHGDEAGVQKAVGKTAENIEDALETEDPAKVSAAALKALDVPDTEEGRLDVANTFGFDTSNIAALDDKIMEVLMAGRATDFQQAVLVGLQNYKSTAMARASAGSGASSFTKDRTALRDYQDTRMALTRSLSDRDLPEGYNGSVADYAAEQALKQVLKDYPIEQIPPQLLNQAGGQPRRPETPAGGLETFLIEAQKINPDSSVEELTEFYTKKYGG